MVDPELKAFTGELLSHGTEQRLRLMEVALGCNSTNYEKHRRCAQDVAVVVLFDFYDSETEDMNYDIPVGVCADAEHLRQQLFRKNNDGFYEDPDVSNVRILTRDQFLDLGVKGN